MVTKYIILAKSNDKTFDIPRQLVEINGEPLIVRTIRLLKENGVKDIIITSDDKRFDGLGAERFDGKHNNFDYIERTGYWLDAFPFELMNEPVCFIWGDVYFSEEAIKIIVGTKAKENTFFCTYNNEDPLYIKHHDEPLAYKIVDPELFKKHITKVKKLYDEGKCCRHPIVWEVYRSMNGQDVNEHVMTKNYIAINDISCDIDSRKDVIDILLRIGGNEMIRCRAIEKFTLGRFDELKNIKRARSNSKAGELNIGDEFECSEDLARYLTGENDKKRVVAEVIEVKPKKKIEIEPDVKIEEEIDTLKPKKKKKK